MQFRAILSPCAVILYIAYQLMRQNGDLLFISWFHSVRFVSRSARRKKATGMCLSVSLFQTRFAGGPAIYLLIQHAVTGNASIDTRSSLRSSDYERMSSCFGYEIISTAPN